MNLGPHNQSITKNAPRRWGRQQRQFGIVAILTLGAWQPAIGASIVECLMAAGMDGPQASALRSSAIGSSGRAPLSIAIRSGQTNLAKMILACFRPGEKDFDYYIEMADTFDQDDIKKLLKQHRKWLKRKAKLDALSDESNASPNILDRLFSFFNHRESDKATPTAQPRPSVFPRFINRQ